MKQNIYLLLFIMLIFSCSKGGNPVPKEIICKVSSQGDNIYKYNTKGELVSLTNNTFMNMYEFSYEVGIINVAYTRNIQSSYKEFTKITLDNLGRVSKLSGPQKILDAKYNNEGYLIELIFHDAMTGNYISTSTMSYENGNLVKVMRVSLTGSEEITMSYSTMLNKLNNGWYANFQLIHSIDYQIPELFSYWGKMSKNLINGVSYKYTNTTSSTVTTQNDVWSYILNENGNVQVAKFQVYRANPLDNYEDEFKYSYQCN